MQVNTICFAFLLFIFPWRQQQRLRQHFLCECEETWTTVFQLNTIYIYDDNNNHPEACRKVECHDSNNCFCCCIGKLINDKYIIRFAFIGLWWVWLYAILSPCAQYIEPQSHNHHMNFMPFECLSFTFYCVRSTMRNMCGIVCKNQVELYNVIYSE